MNSIMTVELERNMDKLLTAFGIAFLGLLLIIFFSCLYALPVWLLWNWLMPTIFGLTKITFLQALGLGFLSSMLFKSSHVNSK